MNNSSPLVLARGELGSTRIKDQARVRKVEDVGSLASLAFGITGPANSTTFTFEKDPWNINLENGQQAMTLSNIRLTYVEAPDERTGALVCYATLTFDLSSFDWTDSRVNTPAQEPILHCYRLRRAPAGPRLDLVNVQQHWDRRSPSCYWRKRVAEPTPKVSRSVGIRSTSITK